jgi:hypothetical protein
VALAVLLSFVFLRNTAPNHKPIYTKGAPQVYRPPKAVDQPRFARASAISVATEFLQTAIERRNVSRSWTLTEPSLHAGFTHREWNSGRDLPFPPYHYRQVRWRPDYSYATRLGLEVALFPAKTEHQKPAVFYLDMQRHGRGKHVRWLVADFMPTPGEGSRAPGIADGAGGGSTGMHIALPGNTDKSPLGAAWLLVPISLLSLILLLPLWLGIWSVIRNKRAEREYARNRPVRFPQA